MTPQPANIEKLAYNRKETAQMLSISPLTLDRLVARGLIRPDRKSTRLNSSHRT